MRYSLELDTRAGQLECRMVNVTTGHPLSAESTREVLQRANDTLDLIQRDVDTAREVLRSADGMLQYPPHHPV